MNNNIEFLSKHLSANPNARDYSGRGMFGKQCVGITCYYPTSQLLAIVSDIILELDQNKTIDTDLIIEIIDILKCCSIDSMGTQQIIYFPTIPYTPLL